MKRTSPPGAALHALRSPDPVAEPGAVVEHGHVRVSVLTDRLVRIEYAHDGRFEDRGSMAVVNRRFPVPVFTAARKGNALTVSTDALTLEVTDTLVPLGDGSVQARIGRGRNARRWALGDSGMTNLGGTTRTLDNCLGRRVRELIDIDADTGDLVFSDWSEWSVEPGLLSRDGWVLVDDTGTVVMDPDADTHRGRHEAYRGWPVPRPEGERRDLYLMAHGEDHRAALHDAAGLFGPQPLPPRYAFGYWYSRYWAYTDRDVLKVVERFDQMGVPLDVMVIDTDWHLPGWSGYTWDRRYFPDPDDTLATLADLGVRVALNVHPSEGVGAHEEAFEAVCRDLGLDPATTDRVPFDVTDPAFVSSYLSRLHHPEEDRGVDFWWMDWQQGTESAVPGLDPLPWLNELHWEDQAARRPDRRPLVFSRWGGLGAGRYPVGFSGDTWSAWESLALQPWFTATSANVLYGYWSHDIGGHYGDPPSPELYARWIQFGVFSPILRTHSTKHPAHERRFWEYPDPYRSAMVDAVKRRYELVPYIYGQCRSNITSGVSLVRPMYHDHAAENAYNAEGQYLFGDDMIVAPVVAPLQQDQLAACSVWLPQGVWYDTALGETIRVRRRDGTWHQRRYLLTETPVFVRAGAVVPGQLDARRLDAAVYEHLLITAYPGADGSGELYEDDGISSAYLDGASVTVGLGQRHDDSTRTITIEPAVGSYTGWRAVRPLRLRVVGELPPARVEIVGANTTEALQWTYDAAEATVVIDTTVDLRSGLSIRLVRDTDLPRRAGSLIDGFPGLARRLDVIAERVSASSAGYELHPDERLATDLSQTANRISRSPSALVDELRRTQRELPRLAETLDALRSAWETAVALLFPDQREISLRLLDDASALMRSVLDD